MKPLVIILNFGALMLLFVPTAQAQASPNFIFSSHECSPLSCVDEVGPDFVGTAAASFDGVCTGGAVTGVGADVVATIGINPQTARYKRVTHPIMLEHHSR